MSCGNEIALAGVAMTSVCDSDSFGIRRVTRGGHDVCVSAMSQNHVCKRVDGWKAAA
jgi:hypothetical protein